MKRGSIRSKYNRAQLTLMRPSPRVPRSVLQPGLLRVLVLGYTTCEPANNMPSAQAKTRKGCRANIKIVLLLSLFITQLANLSLGKAQ